jgi:small-conductance mechanosensitive channel
LQLLVALSIAYVLLRAVDAALRAWQERSRTPDGEPVGKELLPLIDKSVKVFIIVVAMLVTSQNLGLNVTGLTEIFRAHPMTQDVWIGFNKFADTSLNIFAIHWWKGTVY